MSKSFCCWAITATLLAANPAHGFVLNHNSENQVRRWNLTEAHPNVSTNSLNPDTQSIRYYLAEDAFSTTNTTAEINAVRASFDQWQSIPGASLRFEYAGLVAPVSSIDTEDGTNLVFWIKGTTMVDETTSISGALGVAFTSYSPDDNILTQGDIVLNGHQFNWFTDLGDETHSGYFIEGVLLHEIGHFIGLEHSPAGGSTMLARGRTGVRSTQIGLSTDEIAAARHLYPDSSAGDFGAVAGRVLRSGNGNPVFGAVVLVENAAGNLIAGTVTRADGSYQLPALEPGEYTLRVVPLDPNTSQRLISGNDISAAYSGAQTDFLPSAEVAVSVLAGESAERDLTVITGAQSFRITQIRPPSANPDAYFAITAPALIRPGQSGLVVGVHGPNLPASDATLTVTGAGLTLGEVSFANIFPGLQTISVEISVAADAPPGLRSFKVTDTVSGAVAYANGFLEVLPPTLDYNFDGLDDWFQREYFPLFTAAEAAPDFDADQDGFTNREEYIAGTIPTDSASRLEIQSVFQDQSGTKITWQSAAGKSYQVFAREQLDGSSWEPLGAPVAASGTTAQFLDAEGAGPMRFYRVQVLP